MAPFSIPAPNIIPLRVPQFGGPKSIDTNTKLELSCDTYLDHEIYFTVDGTKPQPYAGIVQGSKLFKYSSPFCLPPGKITLKAIAINANVHTMHSSVVTKCFEVLKVDSSNNKKSARGKRTKKAKSKKKCDTVGDKDNNSNGVVEEQQKSNGEFHMLDPEPAKNEDILDCFDEAFIGGSESDENSDAEESIKDECSFPVNVPDDEDILEEEDDTKLCDAGFENSEQTAPKTAVQEVLELEKNMVEQNITSLNDIGVSVNTQFCCMKCDLTLQQCVSCNGMNGISAKFCVGCGKQLSQICSFCTQYNSGIATFCQHCGKKLNSSTVDRRTLFDDPVLTDHSMMAKPESKDVAIMMLPAMIDKNTQTITSRSPVKKSLDLKRMPHHSPGRGYWHQQVDYICNHIKSYAYNNIDFRKEIGEPVLSAFKSVYITKDEDIKVTAVFSSLKNKNHGVNEETEPKMEVIDS